jgi:dTDP-4-dehydrorhamnose reductase
LKVLVFGARGQVGQVLRATSPFADATFLDRAAVDVCDGAAIEHIIAELRPELVINATAFTAVDAAESDPGSAYAVNEAAPAAMASACAAIDARLVHLSTDYVFDGTARRPYRPDDAARPLNVYGASKLAGEVRIRKQPGLRHLVIRTSWVYSQYARNSFFSLLERARPGDRLRIVNDQVGSPTSAWSLAEAIWRAARCADCAGVVHFNNGGAVSRHRFFVAMFAAATACGLPVGEVVIEPISTTEYLAEHVAVAARPAYSVLDSSDFRRQIGLETLDWKVAMLETMERYMQTRHAMQPVPAAGQL